MEEIAIPVALIAAMPAMIREVRKTLSELLSLTKKRRTVSPEAFRELVQTVDTISETIEDLATIQLQIAEGLLATTSHLNNVTTRNASIIEGVIGCIKGLHLRQEATIGPFEQLAAQLKENPPQPALTVSRQSPLKSSLPQIAKP